MSTPKQDLMYMHHLYRHSQDEYECVLGYSPAERVAKFLDTKTDEQKQAIKERLCLLLQQPPVRHPGEPDQQYMTRYRLRKDKVDDLEQYITILP